MGKITRRSSVALVAAVAATLAVAPSASAVVDRTDRIQGDDRVRTAIAAAPDTADTVIIANSSSSSFADALAAAPLAGQVDAPILVNEAGALNNFVRAKLQDMEPSRVIIVGGTSVISETVRAQIAEALEDTDVEIDRLGGQNRFETARAIALLTAAGYDATGAAGDDYLTAHDALGDAQDRAAAVVAARAAEDAAEAELDAAEAALLATQPGLVAAQRALDEANEALNEATSGGTGDAAYDAWQDRFDEVSGLAAAQLDAETPGTLAAGRQALAVIQDLQGLPANTTVADYLAGNVEGEETPSAALVAQIEGALAELELDGDTTLTVSAAYQQGLAELDERQSVYDVLQAEQAWRTTEAGRTYVDYSAWVEWVEDDENVVPEPATFRTDEQPVVTPDEVEELQEAVRQAAAALQARREAIAPLQEAFEEAQEAYNDALTARLNAEAAAEADDIDELTEELAEAEESLLAAAEGVDVFLTTGRAFPDALAAGPVAADQEGVVLLTADATLVDETSSFINDAETETVVAIGGPAAAAYDGESLNFVGDDRYETAANVAAWYFDDAGIAAVASGYDPSDALVAGAVLANVGDAPLLLTYPGSLHPATTEYLANSDVENVTIFGGTAAIASNVDTAIDTVLDDGYVYIGNPIITVPGGEDAPTP